MDYLNETLTNKLIVFIKITKFDYSDFEALQGQREPTCDKIVTEMNIIYQQIICVKIIRKILVEPKQRRHFQVENAAQKPTWWRANNNKIQNTDPECVPKAQQSLKQKI